MAKRAKPSGVSLSETDAAIAKGMLARGDRQHDVAAWFGVNGGRIAEIAAGHRFWWIAAADAEQLPPPGPYPSARVSAEAQRALEAALAALCEAETALMRMRKAV